MRLNYFEYTIFLLICPALRVRSTPPHRVEKNNFVHMFDLNEPAVIDDPASPSSFTDQASPILGPTSPSLSATDHQEKPPFTTCGAQNFISDPEGSSSPPPRKRKNNGSNPTGSISPPPPKRKKNSSIPQWRQDQQYWRHWIREGEMSNVKETELTASEVQRTNSQPTGIMEKITQNENLDSRQPQESNKKTGELFVINDWKHLIDVPEIQGTKHPTESWANLHPEGLSKILNGCKGEDKPTKFFSMKKTQAKKVLRKFQDVQKDVVPQAAEITAYRHKGALFDILLNLSKKRLDLDGRQVLEKRIFERWLDDGQDGTYSKEFVLASAASASEFTNIVQYVTKLTNVATFIIIIYLSLIEDYNEEALAPGALEKLMGFYRTLWIDIDQSSPEFMKENPWTMKLSEILKVDSSKPVRGRFILDKEASCSRAFHIFDYWLFKSGKSLRGGVSSVRRDYDALLVKLIEVMIFHSNYQTIRHKLASAGPLVRRKRKKASLSSPPKKHVSRALE
ncbi:hypothetical protein PGT21_028276 [Puccinia graminis f. sp. tritici]|uniref:Golgi to ER traffic-protein n=1 Tax=Puccinia graminis f. sp. tritici TaxID=56615 RepID=A0A5B0Q712_PUCGR|nr:hypothetical protein PGT21_028276 [Puccinia graminis f. sp. tritici]